MAGSKNRTVANRLKSFYGELVDTHTVKLIRPLKNGKGELRSPKFNKIYQDHGVGSHVMVQAFTNEDSVFDVETAEYTIDDVHYVPDDLTYTLVLSRIDGDTDVFDAFMDSYKEALKAHNIALNVEQAMIRVSGWLAGEGDFSGKKGIIIADNGSFPGILGLLEEIQEGMSFNDDDENVCSTIIVNENNPMLGQCGSLVDLFDDVVEEKPINIEWLGEYYVPEKVRPVVAAITNALNIGDGYFTLTAGGESGSGKTEFAKGLATALNLDFVKINCHSITDPEAWFAERVAKDGNTAIEKTRFANMLDRGNCLVLLDEYNRIPPDLSNPLMPVLDGSRHYELAGVLYDIGKRIVFVLTANIGYEYSGTHAIDAALANRSNATVSFGRLPGDIEHKIIAERFELEDNLASEIMMHMDQIRTHTERDINKISTDLSTRASLNVAFLVKCGLSIFDAFSLAIINNIPDDEMPKDLADYIRIHLNPMVANSVNKRF